jgi:hypothetical protein
VHGTDPLHRDSDLDGLSDGDELFQYSTDPNQADTDGGGTEDAAEIGSGTDPNAGGDDANCSYPNTNRFDFAGASGPLIEPVYASMDLQAVVDGGGFADYVFSSSNRSAKAVFNFYDGGKSFLCSVEYDLSSSGAADLTWASITGGELYMTYDLSLVNGVSTCGPVNAGPYSDLEDLVEDITWGVGFGELDSLRVDLENDVIGTGGDWVNDWEPFVFGWYVSLDQSTAAEVGYVYGYEAACEDVTLPLTPNPVTTGPLADEYYEAVQTDLFTMVELLNAAN